MVCVIGRRPLRILFLYPFFLRDEENREEKGDYLIINSSKVGMESARTYSSSATRTLSYSVRVGKFSLMQDDTEENTAVTEEKVGENPQEAFAKLGNGNHPLVRKIHSSVNFNDEDNELSQVRQRCIMYLWEMLFGAREANNMAQKYGFSQNVSDNLVQLQPSGTTNMVEMTTSEEYFYQETEATSFSTTGTVVTADGREINFNLDLQMSRSFSEYYLQERTQVSMCDPLVINLEGNIAELEDQKFFFDLDADGTEEEISTLNQNSGYLSLDLNQDGVINNGKELFGTQSGDGFADLAKYDEDGNGWIDEADSIYKMLRIWVKDKEGNDTLYTLKEKDVGAIYLGSAETDFTLRGESGNVNGAIRKSGLFLYENGTAGTMQHLDIAN